LAGLPPGRYALWNQEIDILQNGRVVVPGTPFLAGSGSFTDDCVAHLVSLGIVSKNHALEMATNAPRRLLKLPEVKIQTGEIANMIFIDSNESLPFRLKHVVVDGLLIR
jgi:N-acetylglucosamine-6-phosphate deacetylase